MAFCDISHLQMSCSKVFSSKYGRGFGLVSLILPEDHPLNQPNSVYGIIFYSLFLLLSFLNLRFIARLQVRSPASVESPDLISHFRSCWASPLSWGLSTSATSSTSSSRRSVPSACPPTWSTSSSSSPASSVLASVEAAGGATEPKLNPEKVKVDFYKK